MDQPYQETMTILNLRAYARAYTAVTGDNKADIDFSDPMIAMAWDINEELIGRT